VNKEEIMCMRTSEKVWERRDSFFQRCVGKAGWRPYIQTDCGVEREDRHEGAEGFAGNYGIY
jgi:hypothetical protein